MHYTLTDCSGAVLAAFALSPILLSAGYLAARLALPSWALQSRTQNLLWSVVLGLPASLAMFAIAGRLIPWAGLVGLEAVFVVAAVLALATRPIPPSRERPRLLLPSALFALAVYLVLATTAVQTQQHLYEPVSAADWSVRIPLVGASIRSGPPPANPFFTAAGRPQPARYYFYWYALCGAVGRLFGLSPRACLMGSVIWAGFGLVAILLLSLRYLVPKAPDRDRPQSTILLVLCCILGIDVLPAIVGLLSHPRRFTPELEWWRDDRLPSFLSAIVFAPHHVAGLVCAVAGMLVLALRVHRGQQTPLSAAGEAHLGRLQSIVLPGLLAGVCFAATAGTSTYIAFCFAFVGTLFGVDLLWHRRWSSLAALGLAALTALLLSLPFLHSLLTTPALPGKSTGNPFFKLVLRNYPEGVHLVTYFAKHTHHTLGRHTVAAVAVLPFLLLLALEPGFFLVPLILRVRTDLRRVRARDPLTSGERLLWAIFLGAFIPALFISSEPTQGVNDLGRHAGLILRYALVLWATPLVDRYLQNRRARRAVPSTPRWPHPALTAVAVALFTLGLISQLWQIVVDRGFLLLAEQNRFVPEMPFMADTDIAARYLDMRRGMDTLDQLLPPAAVVQSNPGGRYQMLALLYSRRPFAAGDVSCEAAFGGTPALCRPIVQRLQQLFGGPPDLQYVPLGPFYTQVAPDAALTTTVPAFLEACHDLHLSVVVAQNSDPAWSVPGSWVWQPALFATPRVRAIACPASNRPARP